MTVERSWRPVAVTIGSACLVVIVALWTDQGFYSDPAMQVKAVQQFVHGESPTPVEWMTPAPADLSRDTTEALIWWAPGTEFAVWPLLRAGLTPAAAARTVAIVALFVGAAGWVSWFSRFDLPGAVVLAFAMLLPWMRAASNVLFLYSSEILVFAAVPWVLLGVLAADRHRATRAWWAWYAMAGATAGCLYLVKYSATFVVAGVVAWLAWRALETKGRVEPLFARAARVAVVGVCAAVPVVALSAFNRSVGGAANMVTAALGGGWHWQNILYVVANPALAAADLDALLQFVLMHPVHGITQNSIWLAVVGFPGGLVLCSLVARGGVRTPPASLARWVFAASLVAMLIVWTVSTAASVEARHLSSAGYAALPLALAEGGAVWRGRRGWMRVAVACVLVGFVAMPFGYGVVSVFAKAWRYPRDYAPGPSGIYSATLAEHDAAGAVRGLQAGFVTGTDIWYLTEPMSALDLEGRAIVRHADFMPLEELRLDRFITSQPLRVHVLLPPRFEENGKGATIRASFPQATGWRHDHVPGSDYDRWMADLVPAGHARCDGCS